MREVVFQNIVICILIFISNLFIPLETCKLEQASVTPRRCFIMSLAAVECFESINCCQHSEFL